MRRLIIAAVAFLIISISYLQTNYAQEYQGPIDNATYLSTVRITRLTKQKLKKIVRKKSVTIDTLVQSTGTGFFVVRTMPDKTARVFLATNKHMIGDWSLTDSLILDDNIVVGCYTQNNLFQNITIMLKNEGKVAANVHAYPNQAVDVAVIEVTNFLSNDFLKNFALFAIPIENLASLEKLDLGYKIHTGDQVLITGYPSNISIASQGKPIVKSAIISSPLSPTIDITMSIIDRHNVMKNNLVWGKLILIDGYIVGGNSGGPVFTPIQRTSADSKTSRNFVIGIVSSVYNNTGLSLVYASDYIKDLIYQFTQ